MPTRRLPRWVGPAAFVGVLAVALFLSNQTAPLPQGYGTAINDDAEYERLFVQMEGLSQSRIAAYDANKPLTTDDKEKLRQAGNLVDRLNTYRPLMASLYFISGKVHHILGEDEVAEQMFRQCVLGMDRQMADEPDKAPVLRVTGGEAAYQLSQLLYNRHDFKAALDQANLAVRAVPQDSRYHTQLGSVLNELRRTPEAKQELIKAIHLDPNNGRAVSLLRFISH